MGDGSRPNALRLPHVPLILLAYLVLALAMTWPLAAGLASDVPGDLGDSLLNMWILGWGAEQLPRVLTGQMSVAEFWNANIFHPEPLALALSETLLGQVLQILPVYHLTGNLILCYNVLFIGTFALSGLGMYLLVRELTGSRAAGFVGGLVFAFVPYRADQLAHLQTLSSQWMPFALFGFRRYIVTSRVAPLAGGSLALLMQNWSCGYFLVYFAPFVLLFVIHQIAVAGRARDWTVWASFAAAAVVVAAGTWPILALYVAGQRVHGLERPLAEIVAFSANVFSYVTAADALRLLGPHLRVWPKPEGALFPGFVPLALAITAVALAIGHARRDDARRVPAPTPARHSRVGSLATMALAVAACVMAVGLIGLLLTGGFVTSFAGLPIRATNAPRLLVQLSVMLAALLIVSRAFRRASAAFVASPAGFAAVAALTAAWLSLGPVPHAGRSPIDGLGLYALLLDRVPGFEGLRVPARYAMIVDLFLAVLAGAAVAALAQRPRLRARATPLTAALSVLFLAEAWVAPLPVNQSWREGGAAPPARIEPAARAPAVYHHLAAQPGEFAVIEFPFGDPAWELRAVYYSTVHWKRLLNGYSGAFPQRYMLRVARFQRIREAPDAAWSELVRAGPVRYAIVHEDAMPAEDAVLLRAWLESHAYAEVARFGPDVLYERRM